MVVHTATLTAGLELLELHWMHGPEEDMARTVVAVQVHKGLHP